MTAIANADAFISDWMGLLPDSSSQWVAVSAELAEAAACRVEFIGDSYFVGYGNRLPAGAPCRDGLAREDIEHFTDCWQGMAAICMQQIAQRRESLGNVVWRIFARSGRGMVRNYPGLVDRVPLSTSYWQRDRTSPGPHLAVINLGTNDFSTPPGEDESITDTGALERQFVECYHDFLDKLQQCYPGVGLLLVGVPHPSSERQPDLLRQIVRQRSKEGQTIFFCQLPQVPLTGCDAHPGRIGHWHCALALAAVIAQNSPLKVHSLGDAAC